MQLGLAQAEPFSMTSALLMQCYCFMCDGPASECTHWGTGEQIYGKLSHYCAGYHVLRGNLVKMPFDRHAYNECKSLPAGCGNNDHCRAYPSDAHRRKRDSFRRLQANPVLASRWPRQSLPGVLQAQQQNSAHAASALQPPGQTPCMKHCMELLQMSEHRQISPAQVGWPPGLKGCK